MNFLIQDSGPTNFILCGDDGNPLLEIDVSERKIKFHGKSDEAAEAFLAAVERLMKSSQVKCSICGKAVSKDVICRGQLVVRGHVECPECVEKRENPMTVIDADGKVMFPLKRVLMELGNRLVMQEGFAPAYSTIRRDVAQTVACVRIEDQKNVYPLPGRPSTDLIAAFTAFVNMRDEARKHLRELGVQWEM